MLRRYWQKIFKGLPVLPTPNSGAAMEVPTPNLAAEAGVLGTSGPLGPPRPVLKTVRAQLLREQHSGTKLGGPPGTSLPEGPLNPRPCLGSLPNPPESTRSGRPTLRGSPLQGASRGPAQLVNFVLANKMALSLMKTQRERQETQTGEFVRHKNFGMVPKYIKVSLTI